MWLMLLALHIYQFGTFLWLTLSATISERVEKQIKELEEKCEKKKVEVRLSKRNFISPREHGERSRITDC